MNEPTPDWKAIEAEYRGTTYTLREMADRHGVSVADICKHARGEKQPASREEVR